MDKWSDLPTKSLAYARFREIYDGTEKSTQPKIIGGSARLGAAPI